MNNFSAFDIIGPAMIGPSSSHTAGAVRLGLLARGICGGGAAFYPSVLIELHGSFAATGRGHATDRGIVAGLLGMLPDDERLKNALDLARENGMNVEFRNADLGVNAHPNTARITYLFPDGEKLSVTGASIGGGNVVIQEIDGFETDLNGELDALIFWHMDRPGFLARVTGLLACIEANIAAIQTTRRMRNSEALSIIKTDAPLPADCMSVLRKIPFVHRLLAIPKLP
ncbi:MAG TPA: L-serine ammonia-lyase, iron-sulfur-dependent, subunit beta [Candidatus Spyradosoma merdigallinarum]|uniref:L-serine dehydratase n=1 Tax=Candidatus Spyradosoma merdigallinarum TaxID=2840950 RepID=A0A9D1NL11_9BACT|nr:L-serine ammonia-lyase, iron-sulfur-dependent, subunit beta [Candidatus Spyradosoma merdigallinarum]